jgi:hypothetical protein
MSDSPVLASQVLRLQMCTGQFFLLLLLLLLLLLFFFFFFFFFCGAYIIKTRLHFFLFG